MLPACADHSIPPLVEYPRPTYRVPAVIFPVLQRVFNSRLKCPKDSAAPSKGSARPRREQPASNMTTFLHSKSQVNHLARHWGQTPGHPLTKTCSSKDQTKLKHTKIPTTPWECPNQLSWKKKTWWSWTVDAGLSILANRGPWSIHYEDPHLRSLKQCWLLDVEIPPYSWRAEDTQ